MKRAAVRQRRTNPTGRQLVQIVCPRCDGRHWLPADDIGRCPRGGNFTIVAVTRPPKRAAS